MTAVMPEKAISAHSAPPSVNGCQPPSAANPRFIRLSLPLARRRCRRWSFRSDLSCGSLPPGVGLVELLVADRRGLTGAVTPDLGDVGPHVDPPGDALAERAVVAVHPKDDRPV